MRFQNVLLCLVSISYTAFSAPRREISRFCTWSSKVQCKKTQQGYCWKLFLISLIILTFFPKTQFYPSFPRTQHKYTTHKNQHNTIHSQKISVASDQTHLAGVRVDCQSERDMVCREARGLIYKTNYNHK